MLGTTGEATSFSLDERKRVMTAYRDAGLPLERLMVGTGAAAVADAVALTRHAAELGFAGALVLPPFYYKGVPDDGLFAYVEALVQATADKPIPIYLYHFPAKSGLPWHVALIRRLLDAFGGRIVGLKDSSGDMAYAREAAAIAPSFEVFPSTEAVLLEARAGAFAGCISATANLNADLCARAWRDGDQAALDAAVTIRNLFDGKPLVSGVKALLAHIHGDPGLARVKPPLARVLGRRPGSGGRRLRRRCAASAWPDGTIPAPLTRCGRPDYKLPHGGGARRRLFMTASRRSSIPRRWDSHGQYQLRQEGRAQDRAPHRSQQGPPLAHARLSFARSRRRSPPATAAAALAALKAAEPEIMRAAQKGVVHKNTASRKVSRLTHQVAKLGK